MKPLKIFISSTCRDLRSERQELSRFIFEQGHQAILSEHDSFPVNPTKNTVTNCIKAVEGSDIFILIIGCSYGYILENEKSITNMEYIYARNSGVPIFVYIKRIVTKLISTFSISPAEDYSHTVDDSRVLEFAATVRSVNQDWCYDFENSIDIIDNLKIRLTHLFSESLDVWKQLNASQDQRFLMTLSPEAISFVLNKPSGYEWLYLRQVISDELIKFDSLRLDVKYEVYVSKSVTLRTPEATNEYLGTIIREAAKLATSAKNLMSKALLYFSGEPGVTVDFRGFYYVACRLALIYSKLLEWTINVKTLNVPERFTKLRDIVSKFADGSAESIWKYPAQLQEAIEEAIHYNSIGSNEKTKKGSLIFTVEEGFMDQYYAEMKVLEDYYRINHTKWDQK